MSHIFFDEKVISKNDLNLLSDFPSHPLNKEVLKYLGRDRLDSMGGKGGKK